MIHKFINTRHKYCSETEVIPRKPDGKDEGEETAGWTKEDKNNLLGYYKQCRGTEGTIAHISQKYYQSGITNKTQISIIKELLEQDIINESQFNDFMKEQQPEQETEDPCEKEDELCLQDHQNDNEIRALKECLYKENKGKLILWLQKVLMEACFVKLFLSKPEDLKENQNIMEPTTYYYARKCMLFESLQAFVARLF